jgi:hypothetical protein
MTLGVNLCCCSFKPEKRRLLVNPPRRLDYILKKFKLGPTCKFIPVISHGIKKNLEAGAKWAVTMVKQRTFRKMEKTSWSELSKSDQKISRDSACDYGWKNLGFQAVRKSVGTNMANCLYEDYMLHCDFRICFKLGC